LQDEVFVVSGNASLFLSTSKYWHSTFLSMLQRNMKVCKKSYTINSVSIHISTRHRHRDVAHDKTLSGETKTDSGTTSRTGRSWPVAT